MTETRALVLVIVGALSLELGGTLGLMALGVSGISLTFPALAAIVLGGSGVGEVAVRYDESRHRR